MKLQELFQKLGLVADRLRELDAEREVLAREFVALKKAELWSGESLAECCRRGGLVHALPALRSEQRRPGGGVGWRLDFPQRDGRRDRVYLGVKAGEGIGRRVIEVRRRFEAVEERLQEVSELVRSAGWSLGAILRDLE